MELELLMSEEELHNALQNARNDLKKQLMKPVHGDSCIRYVLEVLEELKVQEAFVRHLKNEDFQSFSCRPLELEILVEFIFRCKPPKICIVALAFAVHYNIITQTVTGIEDPYIPLTTFPSELPIYRIIVILASQELPIRSTLNLSAKKAYLSESTSIWLHGSFLP